MCEQNPNQKRARARNFDILRLRGLARTISILCKEDHEEALRMVDRALAKLGAETETSRRCRILMEGGE